MSISDAADSLTLAAIVEEEKLFEEYLAVRAKQATIKAQVSAKNRAKNPAAVATAERAAAEARTALAAQRRRLAEAQQAVTKIKAKSSGHSHKQFKAAGRKSRDTRLTKPDKKKANTEVLPASSITTRPNRMVSAAHQPAAGPQLAPGKRRPSEKAQRIEPKPKRKRTSAAGNHSAPTRARRQLFRANRAAKVEKVVATASISSVECSLCRASVPVSARRCSCGWRVAEGATKLPRVTLSATERTAIASGSKTSRPGKRR